MNFRLFVLNILFVITAVNGEDPEAVRSEFAIHIIDGQEYSEYKFNLEKISEAY